MGRKQMTLAQAEARLHKMGCTFQDSGDFGSTVGRRRIISVPYDVHMSLSLRAAVDCIRRHMPATYMFEERKCAKAGRYEEKS